MLTEGDLFIVLGKGTEMFVKIILLVVFAALNVAIGFMFRKQAANVKGFVLGGHSAGPWISAFAYGTSYFSAVIFVGYAGQFGWKFGLSATWIGIGNALIGSLLAWSVLGRRTRIMTRHLNSSTMPEFFAARFNSKALKPTASAIIFIFLIPYTASLYNGLSRIFGLAFNIDFTICVVIMAALTAVYVVAGGYLATAVNDFIQGIIMLAGIVAVIATVLTRNGGFSAAVMSLANVSDPSVSTQPGVFASFFGPDLGSLVGVIILTSLGAWGMPQMVHKFYAIKNEKSIKAGTVISTFFALIVAGGCYFLGGFGRISSVDISMGFDSVIPSMIQAFPDLLIGVVVMLVLSASMSTLSSLVMTSASTLTLDLIKDIFVKDMKEKKQMLIIRILIVVFIVVSVVVALLQYNYGFAFIAQLMGISWGALAGSFLGPFAFGLFWKRTTKASVVASFIFGVGFTVSNMYFKFIASPVTAGAIAIVASCVVVPLVSLITKKPDEEHIDKVFSCYRETVVKQLAVEDTD